MKTMKNQATVALRRIGKKVSFDRCMELVMINGESAPALITTVCSGIKVKASIPILIYVIAIINRNRYPMYASVGSKKTLLDHTKAVIRLKMLLTAMKEYMFFSLSPIFAIDFSSTKMAKAHIISTRYQIRIVGMATCE